MNRTTTMLSMAGAAALAAALSPTKAQNVRNPFADPYHDAIKRTAAMVGDRNAQKLAQQHGLQVMNLTWEDTGRFKGSAVGPNISDMTIQVGYRKPDSESFEVTTMPVIRFPNFADKSCDIDPHDFTLMVGNEDGKGLKRISLADFLERPTDFLTKPKSWKGNKPKSLSAPRDTKVLVSAQACFLPVPKKGKAEFNPVLFNYQSTSGDPAVLTLLATREGSSVTVIDNKRDAFSTGALWGQRLFFNKKGERASLTGQRASEFNEGIVHGGTPEVGADPKRRESGLNMVLLVQIPLKQKNPMRFNAMDGVAFGAPAGGAKMMRSKDSDVENAVIGHGKIEGPFTEINNLEIERDPKFPVRVTVQFYKATSNGVVSEQDMREIKEQIDRVYAKSDYVGSLVTEGETGRVTEYEGAKVQPADWWQRFWERYESNMGITREEAIRRLKNLLGNHYETRPVTDLYVRSLLKRQIASK